MQPSYGHSNYPLPSNQDLKVMYMKGKKTGKWKCMIIIDDERAPNHDEDCSFSTRQQESTKQ